MNNTEKIALAKPTGLFTLSILSVNIRSCADVDAVYVDDESGAGWGANPVTPREHVCWHTRHTAAGRITVSDPAPLGSALWQDPVYSECTAKCQRLFGGVLQDEHYAFSIKSQFHC